MAKQRASAVEGFEANAERYRQASEPHKSPAAAEEALKAFVDEVAASRLKHQVKDVLLVYSASVIEEGSNTSDVMGSMALGHQWMWESMAAYAYGREKAQREMRIRQLLASTQDTIINPGKEGEA